MENASKALIIAGAILLAILLITLGILVYNQAAGVINSNAMSEVEQQQFNQKFTQYEGTQTGVTLRSIAQTVLSNNISDQGEGGDRQITFEVDGDEVVSANAQTSNTAEIATGGRYTVSISYSEEGPNQRTSKSDTSN